MAANIVGSWSAKKPSAYTKAIESANLTHGTIPPGAHRFQADVETMHNLIEAEFYEIESFAEQAKENCQKVSLPDVWRKRKQKRRNYLILSEKDIIGSNSPETG